VGHKEYLKAVPTRRHSDEEKLKQFSNRVFQIKFIAFEAVCLGSFFYVLYLVVKRELGW
jgi:hypothetical protein